ncbi:hypothetical protein AAMO2058_000116900 [Amorphochlora amoebiformis]
MRAFHGPQHVEMVSTLGYSAIPRMSAGRGSERDRKSGNESEGPEEYTLEIGNTFEDIPEDVAEYSKDGKHLKIYGWTLYARVLDGPQWLIDSVKFILHPTFSPQVFQANMPPFKTTQTSYGYFTARVAVVFCDKRRSVFKYSLVFDDAGGRKRFRVKIDRARKSKKLPMPLDEETTFGIEIELSTPSTCKSVYEHFLSKNIKCVWMRPNETARKGYWKICRDGSITCGPNNPNCELVEIASPVLSGGKGLAQLHRVLQVLSHLNPDVNKSMGVHVHIGIRRFNLQELIRICQQYVKFEGCFDLLVPPSRRSDKNRYCKSNRNGPLLGEYTNEETLESIAECRNIHQLIDLVSPDRYFKLNLQAYRRHKTFEFRQHGGSTSYEKLSYWIRLLVAFCNNAARLKAPSHFSEELKSGNFKKWKKRLNLMFKWVVKDGGLRRHFLKRAGDLRKKKSRSSECCSDCGEEGTCCSPSPPDRPDDVDEKSLCLVSDWLT